MADTAGYGALTRQERERLERFVAAFEAVHPADYDFFIGAAAASPEVEAARSSANALLGSSARREAVRRAVSGFTDAAARAIARSLPVPEVMLAPRPGGNSADRVRLLQTLERAVVAVILWDQLEDADREVLLGPWSRVADRALARRI